MVRGPSKVGVKLNLGFMELSGEWEPSDIERAAAWELYIELITRISVVPLSRDEGLMREALTSLYSVFGTTRDILRRYGPAVASPKAADQFTLGFLAVTILNAGIRPVLSKWHPALADWENSRLSEVSVLVHERSWPQAAELRQTLDATREILIDYAAALAIACGIPDLMDAVPHPPATT
jgi:hypothetical protein